MPQPLFVTFEGLDGSGKSTQLERAFSWLDGRLKRRPVATHEPGGTPLGDGLRALFLDHKFRGMDGMAEALLVFASRRAHLVEVIDPALAAGRTVLCDRFTDSTIAYQGDGRGVSIAALDEIDHAATGRRRPDLTLFFDVPAETAMARRAGGEGGDRLDKEEVEFHRRVRDGYLRLAGEDGKRFRVIDAAASPETVWGAARAALAAKLEIPKDGETKA